MIVVLTTHDINISDSCGSYAVNMIFWKIWKWNLQNSKCGTHEFMKLLTLEIWSTIKVGNNINATKYIQCKMNEQKEDKYIRSSPNENRYWVGQLNSLQLTTIFITQITWYHFLSKEWRITKSTMGEGQRVISSHTVTSRSRTMSEWRQCLHLLPWRSRKLCLDK